MLNGDDWVGATGSCFGSTKLISHIWKKTPAGSTLCCAALVWFPVSLCACVKVCVCVYAGIMFPVLLSWNRPPTQKTNRMTTGSPARHKHLRTHTHTYAAPSKINPSQYSQNRTRCYQRLKRYRNNWHADTKLKIISEIEEVFISRRYVHF